MMAAGRKNDDPWKKQAVGYRQGAHIKIVCAFDDEMFAEVRSRAVSAGTSVAEQVRLLVEWGLEAETA